MKKRFIILSVGAFLVMCAIYFSLLPAAQQTTPPGQQTGLDSLWNIWQDETLHDTTRLIALDQFACDGYLYVQPDSAFYFAQLEYDFAKSRGLKKQMSTALNTQGISYYVKSDYLKALEHHQKCLAIDEELGNKKGIARALHNIGNIYSEEGNSPKALEHYQKSLAIRKGIGDKKGTANPLLAIGIIYTNQGNYPKALEYFQKSLVIKEEIGDKKGIATVLNNIGQLHSDQGNYPKALEYFQKGLAIDEELDNKQGISSALNSIGLIYSGKGNYPEALEYLQKSQAIDEELGNKEGIAGSLHNIGMIYHAQRTYPKALEYYQKSLAIEEELDNKYGIANSLHTIGNIHQNEGNFPKALEHYQKSLVIREELGDQKGIASSLNIIGLIYQAQSNHPKALAYCQKSLALAKSIDVLEEQKHACKCLYATYKAMGNSNRALVSLEQMNSINDSLNAEETAKKLLRMEFAKQVLQDSIATAEKVSQVQEAHAEEVRQEKQTRNWSMVGGVLALLLAAGFYSRWHYVKKSRAALQIEKDRSESLLLNILPEEIAQELKEKGHADARDFDMASILFSDFKEFTQISEKLGAAELLHEINHCFEAFDGIMEKYGIEKIKTIGDAYMAAGGLPVQAENSVKNTVFAGLEMQEFIAKRKAVLDFEGKPAFEMRVGIHTGPVVAGIVGVKKFQYDIWGDTVNTASRMESSGEVGKLNISEATYALLKDDPQFSFENRGKLAVKGKGEIDMYFVSKTEMKG